MESRHTAAASKEMKRVAEAARKDVGSLKKQAAEMVKMKLLKAMVTKQLELEHLRLRGSAAEDVPTQVA